jgi:hypothetical protein
MKNGKISVFQSEKAQITNLVNIGQKLAKKFENGSKELKVSRTIPIRLRSAILRPK